MLYVSTRNNADVYTTYRALHEEYAPDGGCYFPFRFPRFSEDELCRIREQSTGETIANILNIFFGVHLNGWDVECAIGRCPFRIVNMNYRLIVIESWHNPEGSWAYLLKNLYGLLLENKENNSMPKGWVLLAIEISLFFGLYSAMQAVPEDGVDIAVAACDFSEVVSAFLAKDMGFPFNITICAFVENSLVWDFINKGELTTSIMTVKTPFTAMDHTIPKYFEYFLFRFFGDCEVTRYTNACKNKVNYYIGDEELNTLNREFFASVVSTNRVELIKASVYQSNQYCLDPDTALVYGGLQDYRSLTGVSKNTLVLAKKRLDFTKR